MHQEQRQRTVQLLQQRGIDQAVFAHPESLKWLLGFAPPVNAGPSLFTASYPVLWYNDGKYTLITVDAYAALAVPIAEQADCAVLTYQGYTVPTPIESGAKLLAAFNEVTAGKISKRVGVESQYASDSVVSGLRKAGAEITPIDEWLHPLRTIKTADEIAILRRNFQLGDIGHAAARKATIAGNTEIEVWNALESAIQAAAGQRVPLGNDCVVGYRDMNIGGWPGALEIRPGDSMIVDISVIKDGYWSDSCATYFAGERSKQQSEIMKVITDALAFGKTLLKSGAVCKEIDFKLRKFVKDAGYSVYPHHSGHGVGVSGHEAPRLVPYSEEILEPGMVIMLEPGTYIPGVTGVRIEDGMLITENGCEVLTKHDKS